MRSFTVAERRARLARRHFLNDHARSPADVAGDVVGLHATDPATPYLSLWARVPGFSLADLDDELYRRRGLMKHLAMRRTLWVIRTEDLPFIQAGASDRVAGNERRKVVADAQKAGVCVDGDAWLDTASAAVLTHLGEHGPTSARDLRAALPELAGQHDPAPGKRWGGETPLGAKDSDRAFGARRHRPRAERWIVDGVAAAMGPDVRLAALDARRRFARRCAHRIGATVAAGVRPGDGH